MFYLAFSLAVLVLLSCVAQPEEWPGQIYEFLRRYRLHS